MILTCFKSVSKAYVAHVVNEPWSIIADLLTTHIDSETKESTPMFNFAEFKTLEDPDVEPGRRYHYVDGVRQSTYDEIPNSVRRCKGNVISIQGIVLDVDEQMTIEAAKEAFKDIEYVLYTTFRHTRERHKFRIVIPFSQPLLKADIEGRQASICETFPGVDAASFTVSQSFYFHSGLNDSYSYWNEGALIDPYKHFEYREPEVYIPTATQYSTPMDAEFAEVYKAAVVASLNTCSGLHYQGTHKSAVLTLVSLCRSVGMSYNEYDAVCARMAHPESTLTNPVVRVAAWTGWDGDKLRKEKRDAFIAAHGGKPVDVKKHSQEKYQQRMAEVAYLEKLIREHE